MEQYSLKQLSNALHQGELSSVELTQHCLDKIKNNNDLNAFITVDEEHALTAARQADSRSKKRSD